MTRNEILKRPWPAMIVLGALALGGCSGTNVGSSWQCPLARGGTCDSVATADPAVPQAASALDAAPADRMTIREPLYRVRGARPEPAGAALRRRLRFRSLRLARAAVRNGGQRRRGRFLAGRCRADEDRARDRHGAVADRWRRSCHRIRNRDPGPSGRTGTIRRSPHRGGRCPHLDRALRRRERPVPRGIACPGGGWEPAGWRVP